MSAATGPSKLFRAPRAPSDLSPKDTPTTRSKLGPLPPFAADDTLLSELRLGRGRPLALRWRFLRSSGIILGVDILAILGGILVVDRLDRATLTYLVLVPAWLALLGSYRPRIAPSVQADLVPLLGALACPMLVLAWIHTPSAVNLLHDVPVATGLVLVGRLVSYFLRRVARARTTSTEPTLIVGAGILGCQVARVLLDHPEYGILPVGFVDGFPDDDNLPLPVVGDIDAFDEVVRRVGAVRVIVAFGANRETELVEVLRASVEARVEVHIIPRLFELGVTPSGPDADIVWGFPLQHARRAALRSPAWRTKRVVDVAVSTIVLAMFSPVLAAAALGVRMSGPGPVLFRQRRLGQRGEVVEIYKFRSMKLNSDADTRWGGAEDDRVTRMGRVLRATSIDELPQMINVFKGDMSLVGPRPERPHFASQFNQQIFRYRDRLRVPVGLTGWAQVHGLRGDTSIEERARFDNYYIEHWSLWFDLVILARTVTYVAAEVLRVRSRDS
ncbi:MAG: sugar transferase [Actinomycetota bacterium]|nr:sugar transferase [Actinomycetota bacterium]